MCKVRLNKMWLVQVILLGFGVAIVKALIQQFKETSVSSVFAQLGLIAFFAWIVTASIQTSIAHATAFRPKLV